jgi:dolichol kinase
MPPSIHHNSSLSESQAVFAFSILSLKAKRDYVRRSIQIEGYLLLLLSMSTLMLKVALTASSILLFACIALLVYNLIRENTSLRLIQQQITTLCDSTSFQDIVNSSSDDENDE